MTLVLNALRHWRVTRETVSRSPVFDPTAGEISSLKRWLRPSASAVRWIGLGGEVLRTL
jgi:hypothetical protein